jgi:hypothetical protein
MPTEVRTSDGSTDDSAQNSLPIMAMAGWLKDDPLYDAWQAEIAEYRQELDIARRHR